MSDKKKAAPAKAETPAPETAAAAPAAETATTPAAETAAGKAQKVAFLRSHPRFAYWPGDKAELPAAMAKDLIAGGFAEKS